MSSQHQILDLNLNSHCQNTFDAELLAQSHKPDMKTKLPLAESENTRL